MADTTNTRTDKKRNDRSSNIISGVRELRNGIENLLSDSPRSRPGNGIVDSLTNSLISSGLVNAGDYYSGAGSNTIQEGFDYTGIPGGNYLGMLTPKDAAELVFNHNEALYDRQFQEYMSNTSYQRAVADMSAAGINPVLAYRNGGAITPSGSVASAPSGSSAMDVLGLLVNLLGQKNQLAIADVQADATVKAAEITAAAQKYGTEEGKAEASANARLLNVEAEIKELSKDAIVRKAYNDADLSGEQVKQCQILQGKMLEEINLLIKDQSLVDVQMDLFAAQAYLQTAEAWQIYNLTPYMQSELSARSAEEQASAELKTQQAREIHFEFSSGQKDAIARTIKYNMQMTGYKSQYEERVATLDNLNGSIARGLRIFGGAFTAGIGAAGLSIAGKALQ